MAGCWEQFLIFKFIFFYSAMAGPKPVRGKEKSWVPGKQISPVKKTFAPIFQTITAGGFGTIFKLWFFFNSAMAGHKPVLWKEEGGVSREQTSPVKNVCPYIPSLHGRVLATIINLQVFLFLFFFTQPWAAPPSYLDTVLLMWILFSIWTPQPKTMSVGIVRGCPWNSDT